MSIRVEMVSGRWLSWFHLLVSAPDAFQVRVVNIIAMPYMHLVETFPCCPFGQADLIRSTTAG